MLLVISNTLYLEAVVNCSKRYFLQPHGEIYRNFQLTALLAEHENGKENDSTDPVSWLEAGCYNFQAPAKCSDEDEELDLDALRAQALKSVESKQSSKVKVILIIENS